MEELNGFIYFLSVYHEDVNAPQRHHRHKEEPKARPLRVGDTEKPGPEGMRHRPHPVRPTAV